VYARDRIVPRPRRESHRPLVNGDPIQQYRRGRSCEQDGCSARLSRYNPSAHCSLHQGWQDTASRSYG